MKGFEKAVKRMKRIAEEKFAVFIMSVFFFQQSNDIYFKQINLLPLMKVSFSVYDYVDYVVLLSGGVKSLFILRKITDSSVEPLLEILWIARVFEVS